MLTFHFDNHFARFLNEDDPTPTEMKGKGLHKRLNIRRDRNAGDPVIAHLLMVVMTILLSAVLYVVVMSFGGFVAHQPIGTFIGATKETQGFERLTFSSFSPEVKFEQCMVLIDPPGDAPDAGAPELWTITENLTTPYIYNDTITLTIMDLGGEGKVSQGDYIIIDWNPEVMPAGEWMVRLMVSYTGGPLATIMFTI